MGRKSALTEDQWVEIERRVLLEGESAYKLAIEFGVNESSIRRRIKPNKADKAEFGEKTVPALRDIATRKVVADAEAKKVSDEIAALPYAKQQIVLSLAQRLTNISGHLASAAEYGAATAHRLSGIANGQVGKIDDADPLNEESRTALGDIAALTKMANASAEIGLNLLRANKETVDDLNRRELPAQNTNLVVEFVGTK